MLRLATSLLQEALQLSLFRFALYRINIPSSLEEDNKYNQNSCCYLLRQSVTLLKEIKTLIQEPQIKFVKGNQVKQPNRDLSHADLVQVIKQRWNQRIFSVIHFVNNI